MKTEPPTEDLTIRQQAEARLKALQSEVGGQKSEVGGRRSEEETRRLLHELEVHQIELEMQNEELRVAHAETAAAAVRYTDLYDFAPVGYFTLKRDGTISQTNLAGARLLESERANLPGKRFGAFVAESDRPAFNAFREQVFATQPTPDCEVWLDGHDGQPIFVQINATLSAEGQECRAAVVDITELKKSQEALARTAQEWQSTFDASNDAIWLLDEEHRIMRSNRQAARMFPSSPSGDETRCWEVVHGTTGPIAGCPVVRASASLQRETMELQVGDLWYLVTADPILDANGQYAGAVHVLRDITKRKQSGERLTRETKILNETQELTHVGGWEWDVARQSMTWTDELFRIHGMSPDRFPPGSPTCIELSLECYDPEDRPTVSKAFERCMADGQPYDLELPFTSVDGIRKRVRTIGRAGFENDRAVRIVGNVLDITKQVGLESQLRQAQKMESIGRLAGGVAHEFNNLLMGMMNYVELCRDEVGQAQPMRGWLDEITADATRSAAITRQLLAFARKQIVQPKKLDLNDAIDGMLKFLRSLIGADIEMNWSPGSGAMTVKIDPGQIDQILANLTVNARDAIGGVGKFTIETGAVVLDETYCATHEGAVPGDYVRLTVSDTGCGMDKATMADVFEPFFTTKGVGEGTGLGLATVYGIVKQNNGFVDVYSELGKGTTFKIYIPRLSVTAAALAPAIAQGPPPRGTETVLITEDEKSIRITSAAFLKTLGYSVLTAEDAAEALRLAAEHGGTIHLLLTDVTMPGMSGPDLAKQLVETYPEMKCIFMSGFTADVIAQRGVLEKDMKFLSKPFGRDQLARKVRDVLDRV